METIELLCCGVLLSTCHGTYRSPPVAVSSSHDSCRLKKASSKKEILGFPSPAESKACRWREDAACPKEHLSLEESIDLAEQVMGGHFTLLLTDQAKKDISGQGEFYTRVTRARKHGRPKLEEVALVEAVPGYSAEVLGHMPQSKSKTPQCKVCLA